MDDEELLPPPPKKNAQPQTVVDGDGLLPPPPKKKDLTGSGASSAGSHTPKGVSTTSLSDVEGLTQDQSLPFSPLRNPEDRNAEVQNDTNEYRAQQRELEQVTSAYAKANPEAARLIKQDNLKKALAEDKGTRTQYVLNGPLAGIGRLSSGLVDAMANLFSPIPAPDGQTYDQTMKNVRATNPELRGAAEKVLGFDVSNSNRDIYSQQFLTGAFRGLGESIPAMLTPKGVGLYLQAYDSAIEQIDNTEEGKKLPEWAKTTFGSTVGIAQGALEKVGLDKVLKTPKLLNAVSNKIVGNVLKRLGTGATAVTAEAMDGLVTAETNALARKVSQIGSKALSAFVVETGTGTLQETAQVLTELATNQATGKPVFDVPTFGEATGRIIKSGLQEGVGGFVFGAGAGLLQRTDSQIRNNISSAETPQELQEAHDDAVATIQQDPDIHPEDAAELTAKAQEYAAIAATIPNTIDPVQKEHSIGLISKRNEIDAEINANRERLATTDPAFQPQVQHAIDILTDQKQQIEDDLNKTIYENPDDEAAPEAIKQKITFRIADLDNQINNLVIPEGGVSTPEGAQALSEKTTLVSQRTQLQIDMIDLENPETATNKAQEILTRGIDPQNIEQASIPSVDLQSGIGKINLTANEDGTVNITTPDKESRPYAIEDAIERFDLTPQDIQQVIPEYVESNTDKTGDSQSANPTLRELSTTQGEDADNAVVPNQESIPVEEANADGEATTEGTEENSQIESDNKKYQEAIQPTIQSLESLKSKRNVAYEGLIGLPIAFKDSMIDAVILAVKGGAKLADAIRNVSKSLRNSPEVKDLYKTDKEFEDAVRDVFVEKPRRNDGESYHDYAGRVVEWKKRFNDDKLIAGPLRKEVAKSAAPETAFTQRVAAGVNLLRKDITTPISVFNSALGLEADNTEHYVAAIKVLINSNSVKKINAERILQSLREHNPKKVVATEMALLKRSLREREKASREGYKQAKAETKQAFLEYDSARGKENKEKFAELKAKYEEKLDAENKLRKEQLAKTKETHQNIRSEIRDILSGLNRSRLLGGVEYSDRDLISFANRLNNVVTEKGIDRFRDFVNGAIDNADYTRDVTEVKNGIRTAKSLLDKSYVPETIKSLIRDLGTINPNRAADLKRFKAIIADVNKLKDGKEFSAITQPEIVEFINSERENDLTNRRNDISDQHTDISLSDEFQNLRTTNNTNFVHKQTLNDITRNIINDDATTYNEKVRKLNEVEDALSVYKKQLEDSFDDQNYLIDQPEDFLRTLENVKTKNPQSSESQRDTFEEIALRNQAFINSDSDEWSPEQKASLKILQEVPLRGQDADFLRLFSNVLDNIQNNDDHTGMLPLEAKAIGNSDQGALKPVNYINEIGKAPKSIKGRNKILEGARKFRSIGENMSALFTRFANNDFKFLVDMNTGTHFDQIQNGFAVAAQDFNNKIATKLESVFKKHPDIAQNPEAIQRLSLFSYINQFRELASPDQQNTELQKRIATINKDIVLKEGGLDAEKGEAEIERGIWEDWKSKIQATTGIDVTDKNALKGLTYTDIQNIEFLKEGEKAVYDVYRAADSELRPDHENIARGLNKPYEAWGNHMRDGYRFLGSGLVDVLGTEGLGFQATDNNIDSASDSTTQRVKGDPLGQKSGEKQKVLNLNFFEVQNQNIKNMLYDIHTLRDRMIFDEAMKNKDLQDAIGNENHQFYKDAVKENVLTEMGLGKGLGEKELKIVREGLNAITKIGTFKQLLSVFAAVKQSVPAVFNTLIYTGPKLMYQSNQVMGTDAVNKLISKHPISRRADNLANLNILSSKGIGDVDNIVQNDKGVIDTAKKSVENFFNKYFLHMEKNGTTKEPWISKPIKWGDVKAAEWAWVAQYSDYLIKNKIVDSFEDIDWDAQAENPNREAAAYAEQLTSKQLNENTKAGRSKLLNSNDLGFTAAKTILFPFGSFNMHKMQTLVENIRTLASKDTYVNKESFKNQGMAAAKSLAANFAEEAVFQSIKIGIGLSLIPMLQKALVYTLGSLFGTEDETEEYLDIIDTKTAYKAENALHTWFTQTAGNQLFGGIGNTPQNYMEEKANWLGKQAGMEGKIFNTPDFTISQQLEQAESAGMISSAFSGNKDRMRDLYRLIDTRNKYGVPVDITPMQKAIVATSVLSDFLSMAGMNDADVNRSIDQMRKVVDNKLASQFKDPYYKDQNEARPIKIAGKQVQLSDEHQAYYEQKKAEVKKRLTDGGMDAKKAGAIASTQAKSALQAKYKLKDIFGTGEEIKKKKK